MAAKKKPKKKISTKKVKQLILGIVGMPASGKTVVSEYLAKKPKATRIHLGEFIWDFLKRRGIKPTEETGIMASLFIWAEYGDIPVASWALKKVRVARGKKIIIIDALRTMEEARIFKSKFGDNFYLIAVLAGPTVRFGREKARARFGKLSKLDFRMRDREELRVGVGDLIANSDYYIDANKGIADVKKQTDKILKQLSRSAGIRSR